MRHTRKKIKRAASAIAFTLIMCAFLSVCAAALLTLATQEQRLTSRRLLVRQATNDAESTVNYAIAQIIKIRDNSAAGKQFDRQNDYLLKNPVAAPPNELFAADPTIPSRIAKITCGRTSSGLTYRPVGDLDPMVISDADLKKTVRVRKVPILVSLEIPATDKPVTVYAKADLMLRDASLFDFGLFNSVDRTLRIRPGSSLDFEGAIRSNAGIDIAGGSYTSAVNIRGTIQAAGVITNYAHTTAGTRLYGGAGSGALTPGSGMGTLNTAYLDTDKDGYYSNVAGWNFDFSKPQSVFNTLSNNGELINTSGTNIDGSPLILQSYQFVTNPDGSVVKEADGSPKKVRLSELMTLATNGNMQDASHGILPYTPSGLPADNALSVAQQITLPPVPNSAIGADGNSIYNRDIETPKLSTQAGLYIYADQNGGVIAFKNAADALDYKGRHIATAAATRAIADNAGANVASARATLNAAKASNDNAAIAAATAALNAALIAENKAKADAAAAGGAVASNLESIAKAQAEWLAANPDKVLFKVGADEVASGGAVADLVTKTAVYDRSIADMTGKPVLVVDINMAKLRNLVATQATEFKTDSASYKLDGSIPSVPNTADGWNGVVYVDVAAPVQSSAASAVTYLDPVTGEAGKLAPNMTAVRLTGATADSSGTINPDNALVPNRAATSDGGARGFSFATNAPLYVRGHINADGLASTGSGARTDSNILADLKSPKGREQPTLLAGDVITYQSPKYNDKAGFENKQNWMEGGDQEVSAATISSALPRYIEFLKPGGKLAMGRLRGSQALMFNSRYLTQPDGYGSGYYYHEPARQWGFSNLFAVAGVPPGTPSVRSYRKVNMRIISSGEYAAELDSTWKNPDGTDWAPKYK